MGASARPTGTQSEARQRPSAKHALAPRPARPHPRAPGLGSSTRLLDPRLRARDGRLRAPDDGDDDDGRRRRPTTGRGALPLQDR